MFGLLSDTHNHNWSAFSTVDADGINSRNKITIDETIRAAKEVKKAGGSVLIHGGDLFHVRGNIAPSVLNPTLDAYRYITQELGMEVIMVPGNHDMEGRDSLRNTNAVQALQSVGVTVCNNTNIFSGHNVVVMPWFSSVDELKINIQDVASGSLLDEDEDLCEFDLVLHAPVDDVIAGIPDHGLTADWLAEQGFKRVFCGHYHNHKSFGNGVYSIGALTHQTWGDVGSKAGFLLVGRDDVTYRASRAPQFIDLDPSMSHDDIPLIVDGNYVRARVEVERESQIQELREYLMDCGAAGVVIHPIRTASEASRTGSTAKTGESVEASIADFIKAKSYKSRTKLGKLCVEILSETEAK